MNPSGSSSSASALVQDTARITPCPYGLLQAAEVRLVLYNDFMQVLEKAFCAKLAKFAVNSKLFRIGKMQTDCEELLQKLMRLIGQ